MDVDQIRQMKPQLTRHLNRFDDCFRRKGYSKRLVAIRRQFPISPQLTVALRRVPRARTLSDCIAGIGVPEAQEAPVPTSPILPCFRPPPPPPGPRPAPSPSLPRWLLFAFLSRL